jgi:hypothetical protein
MVPDTFFLSQARHHFPIRRLRRIFRPVGWRKSFGCAILGEHWWQGSRIDHCDRNGSELMQYDHRSWHRECSQFVPDYSVDFGVARNLHRYVVLQRLWIVDRAGGARGYDILQGRKAHLPNIWNALSREVLPGWPSDHNGRNPTRSDFGRGRNIRTHACHQERGNSDGIREHLCHQCQTSPGSKVTGSNPPL